MFLYNTGARVQEVVDLKVANLELGNKSKVHLHGKGDKWRICPIWEKAALLVKHLLNEQNIENKVDCPVFQSKTGQSYVCSKFA